MTVRDALNDRLAPADGESVPEAAVEPELEVEPNGVPAVAEGSMLAQLRARAAQLRAQQTVDLAIPCYEEIGMYGRYRATSIARAMAATATINPAMPEWTVAADTLARALEQLMLRNAAGELEPFAPGVTMRYDDDLVAALDLRPDERSARAVMCALFGGGEKGESLISAHFMAYIGWLMTGEEVPALEVARQVVGESPAR